MAIAFVSAGAGTTTTNGGQPAPALPASMAAGDLMLTLFHSREVTDGTVSISAGWNQIVNERTSGGLLAAWERAWQSGDAAPTVTVTNHTSSNSGDSVCCQIVRITGASTSTPIGTVGTIGTNAAAGNIGPFTGITINTLHAVVTMAGKLDDRTSTQTFSTDGLTWIKMVDLSNTLGTDNMLCCQLGVSTSGSDTAVADKTQVISGGTSVAGKGVMFEINIAVATKSPPRFRPSTRFLRRK